jgi:hypothetical protein
MKGSKNLFSLVSWQVWNIKTHTRIPLYNSWGSFILKSLNRILFSHDYTQVHVFLFILLCVKYVYFTLLKYVYTKKFMHVVEHVFQQQ